MNQHLPYSFKIISPEIPSAGLYFFTTDSGTQYEVRFGRRKDNFLHVTISFGVINDEYEGEEYTETNKGEIYRVMSTLVQIIRMFIKEHQRVMIYEFTGTARKGESGENASARINLYKRYIPIIFPEDEGWSFIVKGSNAIISRARKN